MLGEIKQHIDVCETYNGSQPVQYITHMEVIPLPCYLLQN